MSKRPMRWQVVVSWTVYALPSRAELDAWTTAVDGRIQPPATLVEDGYPKLFSAEITVEATTLRKALAAGLARVEDAVGYAANGVTATRTTAIH
jgi:hypothetical protein